MAELIRGLDPERIRANLAEARAKAGDDVAILAAVKYVALEELGALAEAGIELVGENRVQELERKRAAWGGRDRFTWDFIGHLQSRKVRQVLPLARWIHSVGSDSVLRELGKHGTPETEVLIEVNVAREEGKSGFLPDELAGVLERCPVTVVGLMTMPPLAERAEDSRRWFAALAQLAADHHLRELSMGTSQDYEVAAQEGATIVRLGSSLYR